MPRYLTYGPYNQKKQPKNRPNIYLKDDGGTDNGIVLSKMAMFKDGPIVINHHTRPLVIILDVYIIYICIQKLYGMSVISVTKKLPYGILT